MWWHHMFSILHVWLEFPFTEAHFEFISNYYYKSKTKSLESLMYIETMWGVGIVLFSSYKSFFKSETLVSVPELHYMNNIFSFTDYWM